MRNSSEFPSVNTQETAGKWGSLVATLPGAVSRNSLGINRYDPQNSGTAESATNRNVESNALHRCFGGDV